MNYEKLNEILYQINHHELENKSKNNELELDLSQKPIHFDTKKYFNLEKNMYYFSVQERYKNVKLHTHGNTEINYIYSGKATQWINGKKYSLKKGDFIVLDKLVPHAIEATGQQDIIVNLQMYESFFSGDFIKQFVKESIIASSFFSLLQEQNNNNFLIFKTGENFIIKQTIQNIMIEHFEAKIGSNEMIKSYMLILFGELLRTPEFYINKEQYNYDVNFYIPDILIYLENNYISGCLNEVSSNFSISPVHLTRLLKKYLGKTYKQMVHEKRISMAHKLLLTTSKPIYEIAEDVGYSNLNMFNKKFKEKYGVLPGKIDRISYV